MIKSLLMVVLVVTALGAGGLYLSQRLPSKLQEKLAFLRPVLPVAQRLLSSAQSMPLVQTQMSKVLGVTTGLAGQAGAAVQSGQGAELLKSAPAQAPQFAFEKVRYTYCKQVVEDFDRRYSGGAAVSASPAPIVGPPETAPVSPSSSPPLN